MKTLLTALALALLCITGRAAETSKLYADTFLSYSTPNFKAGDWGYGVGVGYQVSKFWSADLRLAHTGLNFENRGVSEIGGRLVARMPFQFLSPYTFLGGTYRTEFDDWRIRPGAGIEFSPSKRWTGLSLFAEGNLDANTKGANAYQFTGGVRLRF